MLKVGVVGFGFMGRMHYRCWQRLADAEVVAICDTNPNIIEDTDFPISLEATIVPCGSKCKRFATLWSVSSYFPVFDIAENPTLPTDRMRHKCPLRCNTLRPRTARVPQNDTYRPPLVP